jgi:CMP-N,N'-diacetyllegionaminic acid synthase
MDAIAIIPARGGSKGVPGKNIVPLSGHPLIAYSIIAAQQSQCINRVVVSTDSPEIAAIARKYGAEVPFLRPAEFSTDTSTDRDFLLHAVQWFDTHEGFQPEYLVHLRPTTPLREPAVIDRAVQLIQQAPSATSLRSAHLAAKTPYKWFEMDSQGYFQGIRPYDTRPEYYNLPRQSFPPVYDPNGYVDVVRASQLLNSQSVHGCAIIGFITPHCHDVDSLEDLELLNFWVERHGSMLMPFLRGIGDFDKSKK